jgi:type III pantothenate kinase
MLLCLDIGNSHLFGGIFVQGKMQLYFRHNISIYLTSDQIGVFLRNVLRENSINAENVEKIAISSVVPSLDYSVRAACLKYFKKEPCFLTANNQKVLNIKIHYPNQLGADLVSTGIAAAIKYPNKDIIVIDFGTATTFAAIDKKRQYLGTVITPGLRLSMESLQSNTEKLPAVEIVRPKNTLGKETIHSIQSGLYYGHLGMAKEVIARLKEELSFQRAVVIATGGFAYLFEHESLFDVMISDLLFYGLYHFISNDVEK